VFENVCLFIVYEPTSRLVNVCLFIVYELPSRLLFQVLSYVNPIEDGCVLESMCFSSMNNIATTIFSLVFGFW